MASVLQDGVGAGARGPSRGEAPWVAAAAPPSSPSESAAALSALAGAALHGRAHPSLAIDLDAFRAAPPREAAADTPAAAPAVERVPGLLAANAAARELGLATPAVVAALGAAALRAAASGPPAGSTLARVRAPGSMTPVVASLDWPPLPSAQAGRVAVASFEGLRAAGARGRGEARPSADAAHAPPPPPGDAARDASPPTVAEPRSTPTEGRVPAVLRVVWRADADGRLLAVEPDPAEAFGIADDEGGGTLDAVLGDAAALRAALASAGTAAIRTTWRLRPGLAADARLGAERVDPPAADGATLRGFAALTRPPAETADAPDADPAARPSSAAPQAAPATAVESGAAERGAKGPADADGAPMSAASPPPASAGAAAEPAQPSPKPTGDHPSDSSAEAADAPRAPSFGGEPVAGLSGTARAGLGPRVLPLRALPDPAVVPDAPDGGEEPAAPARLEGLVGGDAHLSQSERRAFREIARVLGGRADKAPRPPRGAECAPAPSETQPSSDGGADAAGDARAEAAEAAGAPPRRAPKAETPATALLDALPFGVLVSRGAQPLFANRALLELTGYGSLAELRDAGGVPTLLPHGTGSRGEGAGTALRPKAGGTLPCEARAEPVVWAGVAAVMTSLRHAPDLDAAARAARLASELEARDSEVRDLRAVLDTATDGVVTLDADGRILSCNRAAEALFGHDRAAVAGESITALLAPESHAPALDYLARLQSGGMGSVLNDGRDVVGRERGGGRLPLFMTLGEIGGADGGRGGARTPDDGPRPAAARRFCAVLRDMTAFRNAERDLTEARRVAEASSEQKSAFLAKISHEIRTPLNAIIGFAEVMNSESFGPIGNARYKDYLRDIQASGTHVISLVNDLLDLSKIEAGRMELDLAPLAINEIVSGAVSIIQPQAARARIIVRTSLSSRGPLVQADERSLRQIVLNLLSNAVKFTDAGGQVIVSTVQTERGDVAIRVRDTGIGMSEDELATALEPFRQVATSGRGGGTGLGLPLTKALVEANRAALAIRSVKHEGTLVEVTFPPAAAPVA